ncbi:MAG: ABC transporter substrate-binding protein [Deltaproteobacteria bacterium]|nr:ABC transporter substrate-binding protein [Deltaproteobacteria bacterium]
MWKIIFPLFLFSVSCSENKTSFKKKGIVSLSPSLTEIVFALGKGDSVNCVTTYDNFPEDVKKIPKVGGFLDANIERILQCNPKLVLITEMHLDLKKKLKEIGIPYLELRTRSVSEIRQSIVKLSEKLVVSDKGHAIIKEMDRQLKIKSCMDNIRKKVLVTLGRSAPTLKNVVGAGRGTYLDELIVMAGGKNVLEGKVFSYPSLGAESLVALAPDIIIDIVPSGGHKKDWDSIPFLKTPRIFIVNDSHMYSPGVRIVESLKLMRKIICGSDN